MRLRPDGECAATTVPVSPLAMVPPYYRASNCSAVGQNCLTLFRRLGDSLPPAKGGVKLPLTPKQSTQGRELGRGDSDAVETRTGWGVTFNRVPSLIPNVAEGTEQSREVDLAFAEEYLEVTAKAQGWLVSQVWRCGTASARILHLHVDNPLAEPGGDCQHRKLPRCSGDRSGPTSG